MPRGTRASPGTGRAAGPGHNSGLPDHGAVRKALAVEFIFEERKKKLNEEHKRARKKMQGDGIVLDDLTDLKGMKDKTGSELVDLFRRRWHLAGALHADKFEQLDLFVQKSDAPTRTAHFTMGMMQGLKGAELEVPPMVVGEDRQLMIDGHNEGRALFDQASQDVLASALDPKNEGKVTDGTTGAVAAKAAQDFAADNGGDPLVVNGEKYQTMRQANAARTRLQKKQEEAAAAAGNQAGEPGGDPEPEAPEPTTHLNDPAPRLGDDFVTGGEASGMAMIGDGAPEATAPLAKPANVVRPDFHEWDVDWTKWTGPQIMEFRRWFDSKPADHVPAITHEGAVGMWRHLVEERAANAKPEGTTDAEWEAAGRKAPQTAETPDPADVEAGARKLAENGFVDTGKKTTRSRTPTKAR